MEEVDGILNHKGCICAHKKHSEDQYTLVFILVFTYQYSSLNNSR